MFTTQKAVISLVLLSAAMPLHAGKLAPGTKTTSPSMTEIRAEFAAKDATITDLRRQVAEQSAQISQLRQQAAAPVVSAPAVIPAPAATAGTPPKPGDSVLSAPANAAIHLALSKPATSMTSVLGLLSTQAGVPILADDTVGGTLSAMSLEQPGLEPALDQLKSVVPGLTWQKVYLPKSAALPKSSDLSQQVRSLKTLPIPALTVSDAATRKLLSFAQQKQDAAPTAPEGMQTVYLVTNETVYAQRLAAQKAATLAQNNPAPGAVAQGNVGQAVSGLQNTSSLLSQMTPDEQRQALPQMFQQFGQMMRNIDPSVRAELFQQFRQFGQ